ncbi:MAG: hypothetical protein ACPHUL_00815 [Marinomonas gallaica]
MALVDGKGTSFTFDGVTVGKIDTYDVVDAITQEDSFIALDNTQRRVPTYAQFGEMGINLYRSLSDVGQARIESARVNLETVTCVWTLNDGSTLTFDAFVRQFPIVGSDGGTGTVRVILRMASSAV